MLILFPQPLYVCVNIHLCHSMIYQHCIAVTSMRQTTDVLGESSLSMRIRDFMKFNYNGYSF